MHIAVWPVATHDGHLLYIMTQRPLQINKSDDEANKSKEAVTASCHHPQQH
jgi:hypothetical protein